jgi:hypothetical protein
VALVRAARAPPQLGGLAHGGPVAFKHTVLTAHPVEAIQRAHFKNEGDAELLIAERVYGAHAAWQMKLDRALVSHTHASASAPAAARQLHRSTRAPQYGVEPTRATPTALAR